MLNFPNTPVLNQLFTSGSASWYWDGIKWAVVSGDDPLVMEVPVLETHGGTGVTNLDNAPLLATGSTTHRTLGARAAEFRNVRDFGAVLNGTTSDSAAFQLAYNATPDDGTITVPRGGYNVPTPPTRASGNVLWKLDGNRFGTGTTPVVYAGGLDDVSESFVSGRKQFSKTATNTTPFAVLNVALDFENIAGTNVVSSALHVSTTAGTNCGSTFVWGVNSEITSLSNGSNQNLAGAFTMRKLGTAPVFALFAQGFDNTGSASSVSGNVVACEIDLFANLLDDKPGGGRGILNLVWGRSATGFSAAPMSINRAFIVGPKAADAATSSADIIADFAGTFNQAGINLRAAVQGASANALWLATGHRLALDTAGTAGAAKITIRSDGNNLVLGQLPANAANDAAAAAASVPVGGVYRNGSTLQIRVV